MTLDLFSQFASPNFLGIPLIIIAVMFPWMLFLTQSTKLTSSRMASIQSWSIKYFTKQIFYPLSTMGHTWALVLTSMMIFLLGMNLLGLLPYTFTPTSQLSLNLALAVPMWLATVVVGFRNQLTISLGHLLPEGTPTPLIPVLIIIETVSLFIRPIALGVRLTANLTAGHLLIHLVSMATIAMSSFPLVSSLTFIILILLTILEIAVAIIQAYVFILLLSLYLQENT